MTATSTWIMITATALGTAALRAAGPALLDGRQPSNRVRRVLDRLAPALLAALIVVNIAVTDRRLTVDARLAGLAIAALALWLRLPLLLVILGAILTTAVVRII
jgi:branched-subunit amino acid transport protein AzlD